MRKTGLVAILVVLASIVSIPAINSASAVTVEDGRTQISPKSYGKKTAYSMCEKADCFMDKVHNSKFEGIKKIDWISYKKNIEYYNALQFMKTYYQNKA